ncbi:MAG: rhomboid family intramembrane serine protease [Mangrovibacterium sp.]
MNNFRNAFSQTPMVVKNIILINIMMFLLTIVLGFKHVDLNRILGLYYIGSSNFQPFQIVTHMFMHGGLAHIFFNMYALWMFGRVLESVWGPKRFFVFYFITGLGAAALHMFAMYVEFHLLANKMDAHSVNMVLQQGAEIYSQGKNYTNPLMAQLNLLLNTPTVGASGAIFGVLLGFGMLFPNTQLLLLIPPMPIKAKYFVMIYGALELYLGFARSGGNVAHFAHVGGMIFGYILIRYWNKNTNEFY